MSLTKIVATIGPASQDIQTITSMVKAGCDVFRVNFSHGSAEEHALMLQNIRQVEQDLGKPLAVIAPRETVPPPYVNVAGTSRRRDRLHPPQSLPVRIATSHHLPVVTGRATASSGLGRNAF